MENKVIFESDEHFENVMDDIIPDSIVSKWSIIKNSGEDAKQKGYIRKSPAEEAEEFLNKNVQVWSFENRELVARGFWELKSEIERLKK